MSTKGAKNKKQEDDGYDYYRRAKHLIIKVGWQYNGGVYGLDPLSEDRVRETYPDALINPGLRIGYDKSADYNRYHRRYWPQIAMILTGLTPAQIDQLGGVEIRDPEREQTVWMWRPSVTESA
jgi:hypothetical protein